MAPDARPSPGRRPLRRKELPPRTAQPEQTGPVGPPARTVRPAPTGLPAPTGRSAPTGRPTVRSLATRRRRVPAPLQRPRGLPRQGQPRSEAAQRGTDRPEAAGIGGQGARGRAGVLPCLAPVRRQPALQVGPGGPDRHPPHGRGIDPAPDRRVQQRASDLRSGECGRHGVGAMWRERRRRFGVRRRARRFRPFRRRNRRRSRRRRATSAATALPTSAGEPITSPRRSGITTKGSRRFRPRRQPTR